MITVKTKTVKLSEIHLNPDNPRTITEKAMDRLVKSLQEFPEMLKLREIVVDETMTVLGGNMRLLALQKSGAKDCIAKVVTGFTPEQKREFVIKDNASFGAWDFDALANSWDDLPLVEWGVDLPEEWSSEPPPTQPESETYRLIFEFLKDDAAYVTERLHSNRETHKENLDEKWRERCLLRLLKQTE